MTATTIRVQMAQRKDTAANWTAANPILLSGEIGYETDTKKFKIGNGSSNWNTLTYLPIPDGSGNLTITGNLEIGTTGSLTFEGSTANAFETTLAVTDPTADRTITLPDRSGTVITSGDTGTVTSTMLVDGTIVNADISATAEIAVSKLANGTANQVLVTDGTDVSWSDNLTLAGNLTVNGTTTTIDSQTLLVEDKNIEMGVVATPTDVTADGGGITLRGTTNKTINWIDSTDSWTSSEHVDLASGKSYRINNTVVLSSTTLGAGVTGSSLTSVGTIGTGVWQGTAINATYLDATLVKTSDTGTVTSTMIADGTIVNADISASAEIAVSKLADGTARQLLQTDAAGTGVEWASNIDIPGTLDVTSAATFDSSVAVTGALTKSGSNVVTVGDTGTVTSTMIADGTIVNADVNASAAIAGTKISPDFGSQNRTSTGTSTAASFIPTSSTAPTNGLYLSAANSVALSTGGSGRLFINSAGSIGIGSGADLANSDVHLVRGTGAAAYMAFTGNNNTITGAGLLVGQSSTGESRLFQYGNNPITFSTQSTERLRITGSGLVGIGTSSVETRLHVRDTNSGATTTPLLVQNRGLNAGTKTQIALIATQSDLSDGGYAAIQAITGGTGSLAHNLAFLTCTNGGVPTERLYITSAGNVGIGTTSPSSTLTVGGNPPIGGAIAAVGAAAGVALALSDNTNSSLYVRTASGGAIIGTDAGGTIRFATSGNDTANEKARIDNSGRLLIGTSSAETWYNSRVQIQTSGSEASYLVIRNSNDTGGSAIYLGKSRGTTANAVTVVQDGDGLGEISFLGADGTDVRTIGARIQAVVDGSPGVDDLPTRLVFSTTADGAPSPTERLRITNDGVRGYNQPAPVAVDATATLTVANLKTGIITSTTAAAVTMTLPTGTLTEGGFSGLYTNFTFEWTVINTGATNAVTVQGDTGHTLVGSGTVAAGVSGRFASRRTAANTFVTYRLS